MAGKGVVDEDISRSQYLTIDNVTVPVTNILRDLVLDDQKRRQIYLVGEGNFTFTVALVALRGSWEGITTTCLGENILLANFSETKLISIEWCIKNAKMQIGSDKIDKVEVCDKLEVILKVPRPNEVNVEGNVDATACTLNAQNIVWFQCPWLHAKDKVEQLLRDFLAHMNGQQKCNDYVFIGIANTKEEPYRPVEAYKIEQLLEHAPTVGYKFIGADNSFIREILAHGYKHVCVDDISDLHEFLFHSHVTLVFGKK